MPRNAGLSARWNLNFFPPSTSVARGAAAPLPSRRLRLALIKRLVAASRRNEPPGPVPKWTARQARLDERELIRTYRLASHDALNDSQAAKELARGLGRVLNRRRRAFDALDRIVEFNQGKPLGESTLRRIFAGPRCS